MTRKDCVYTIHWRVWDDYKYQCAQSFDHEQLFTRSSTTASQSERTGDISPLIRAGTLLLDNLLPGTPSLAVVYHHALQLSTEWQICNLTESKVPDASFVEIHLLRLA